jgi:hypothetical protein
MVREMMAILAGVGSSFALGNMALGGNGQPNQECQDIHAGRGCSATTTATGKNRTAQAAAKKKQLTGSSREIDVIASTA